MPVTINQTEFSDFEALQQIVQGTQTEVVQTGRGRTMGIRSHATIDGSFTLSSGAFNNGIRLKGVPSPDKKHWLLGMALSTEGPATAQSHEMLPGSLLIIPPGHERYSAYQGTTHYAMALIGDGEMQNYLEPEGYDALLKLPGVLADDPARAAERIAQMSALTNALTDPKLPDQAIHAVRQNLLGLLTGPVTDPLRYHGATLRASDRLVREMDRYIVEVLATGRWPDISELAAHFRTPKRTLHRVFKERMGMPPVAFARNKKLGDVHTALLDADPEHAKVAEIAEQHGFIEGGRFAAFYRRRFAELPHETLRRRR
jgi:AraC family ethanolamine operon transcriptional activator